MKKALGILSVTILMLLLFSNCEEKKKPQKTIETASKQIIYKKLNSFQTLNVNDVLIDIYQNDSIWNGDILVLPGWNFSRKKWCDSTQLCSKALSMGYRLIMPEMGKSVYSSKYFAETRTDWKKFPTSTWLTDTLIVYLKENYGIFTNKKNYILGLSTGARGALLVALKTDSLFVKGAALSGDYDQSKIPNDNLMTGFYGSYYKNKERWHTTDNVVHQIKKLKTQLYLGHAQNDWVVPVSQTNELADSMKKYTPSLLYKYNSPTNMGHTFKYWNSEIDSILKFFHTN